MSDSSGNELFRRFLQQNNIKEREVAEHLGVSGPAVHRWRVRGKPKQHLRRAIEIWTSGFVPALAWERPEERAIVEKVKPFTGKVGLDA